MPNSESEESESAYFDSESNSADSGGVTSSDAEDGTREKGPFLRGRKRSRPETHARNIRKRKIQRGEEYIATTGRRVPGKRCSRRPCECRLQCHRRIDPPRRRAIFKHYYSLSYVMKNAFIAMHVNVTKTERSYTEAETSRRGFTRKYKLIDMAGEPVQVCKEFFKGTISVTDGKITNALKLRTDNQMPIEDRRGRHPPHNKSKAEDVEFLTKYIEKFPSYSSHYGRRDNLDRKYLAPELNLNIMYQLYRKECEEHNRSIILSNFVFRDIFNTRFNLQFHRPRVDTCATCDRLHARITALKNGPEKDLLKTEQRDHQSEAQAMRDSHKRDIAASEQDGSIRVLVFDLQKTLPTPVLSTGIAYYKRQMWTYNLGIHDETHKCSYMYVWDEHVASRGAQEVGSCLVQHIKKYIPPTVKHLILYSDSCGGQNRNIKITLLLMFAVATSSTLQIIDQKFFIPGHSFSSCDRDFALIEKAKRYHPDVYVPEHWIKVIQSAKKSKPYFTIERMDKQHFMSSKKLEDLITNRKTTTTSEKVSWLKMRWSRLHKSYPKKLLYKTTHEEATVFKTIDFHKRARGRVGRFENVEIGNLFPDGRTMQKEKIQDLKHLLQYIPPIYHQFYHSLINSANDEEDFGLFGEDCEDLDDA